MYNLCFCADCEIIVHIVMRFDPWPFALVELTNNDSIVYLTFEIDNCIYTSIQVRKKLFVIYILKP